MLPAEVSCVCHVRQVVNETALIVASEAGHVGVVALLLSIPHCDAACRDVRPGLHWVLGVVILVKGVGALCLDWFHEKLSCARLCCVSRVCACVCLCVAACVCMCVGMRARWRCHQRSGRTPLLAACASGHADVVELLCSLGAVDVNLGTSMGVTPIHAAAAENHVSAVEALLRYHADANLPNLRGATPLYTAALRNNVDSIAALLRVGSLDVNAVDVRPCRLCQHDGCDCRN